jgi:acyl-coenzyme A thioesterase PaaI-like protein
MAAPSGGAAMVHSRAMIASAPLLDVFRARFAGLEELRFTLRPDDTYSRCFGCGPGHPTGLRVRCFKVDGGVLSPIMIDPRYEGPPGAAHGGIVAAYLDEVLAGAVVRGTGRIAVTGELTVRYVKPVPLETPLVGRAHLVADHGRYADVEGRIEDLVTADVLATARGRFMFIVPKSASPAENRE